MSEAVKKAFPDGCGNGDISRIWRELARRTFSLLTPRDGLPGGPYGTRTSDGADGGSPSSLKVQKVIIVGGTVAVSDDVKLAVEAKKHHNGAFGAKLYADGG